MCVSFYYLRCNLCSLSSRSSSKFRLRWHLNRYQRQTLWSLQRSSRGFLCPLRSIPCKFKSLTKFLLVNNSALFREQRVSICSCTSLNHVVRIPCTELACLWKLGLQILYWACHTRDKHVKRTRHAGYLVHQELLQEIPHKVYNSYILHEHVPRSWILKSVRKLILVLNDKTLFFVLNQPRSNTWQAE